MLPVVRDFYNQYMYKEWQSVTTGRQMSSVFRYTSWSWDVSVFWLHQCILDVNCCAELHVGKKNCVKSFEKVNSYRELWFSNCKSAQVDTLLKRFSAHADTSLPQSERPTASVAPLKFILRCTRSNHTVPQWHVFGCSCKICGAGSLVI